MNRPEYERVLGNIDHALDSPTVWDQITGHDADQLTVVPDLATGARYLIDAIAAHQQHDDVVNAAALLLDSYDHPGVGQRLRDTWAAIGDDDPTTDHQPLTGLALAIAATAVVGLTAIAITAHRLLRSTP